MQSRFITKTSLQAEADKFEYGIGTNLQKLSTIRIALVDNSISMISLEHDIQQIEQYFLTCSQGHHHRLTEQFSTLNSISLPDFQTGA